MSNSLKDMAIYSMTNFKMADSDLLDPDKIGIYGFGMIQGIWIFSAFFFCKLFKSYVQKNTKNSDLMPH